MANNMMWIVCKTCAESKIEPFQLLLAKFWGTRYDPWHGSPFSPGQSLREFFEDHAGCSIEDENCFELRYEITPRPAPNTSDAPAAGDPNRENASTRGLIRNDDRPVL